MPLPPEPFILIYWLYVFSFSLFFVSVPYARLSWLSRQLLSACKYSVSYRIDSVSEGITFQMSHLSFRSFVRPFIWSDIVSTICHERLQQF